MSEPMMNQKRECSSFLPHRHVDGVLSFYLQKRGKDARYAPGMVGVFGGGMEEGETIEQTLIREVREELNYTPQHQQYFCRYEFAHLISHLFIEEVGMDFESKIIIGEGDYGKFFTLEEAKKLPEIVSWVLPILMQVTSELTK